MNKPGPYHLHRAALQPLLQEGSFDGPKALVKKNGEAELLSFLHQQGLSPMWAKALESEGSSDFSDNFKSSLHQARLRATGEYLIQHNRLKNIRTILDAESIAHVVYKGADIRERYYTEPSLRPAVDIDVLVSEDNKVRAIEAFHGAGYTFSGKAENISHEANLTKGKSCIDLHWDILRPGRTRVPMAAALMETRQGFDSHWGMNDEANLFVMLVHPIFAKYGTTPQASLMRTVDLWYLLERDGLAWQRTLTLLEDAGLKTAAWITLRWLQLLTDTAPEPELLERLTPGKLRKAYLERWLKNNLATRFLEKPALVQMGFTLPAHDKPSDALRAIKLKRHADENAAGELEEIENSLPK